MMLPVHSISMWMILFFTLSVSASYDRNSGMSRRYVGHGRQDSNGVLHLTSDKRRRGYGSGTRVSSSSSRRGQTHSLPRRNAPGFTFNPNPPQSQKPDLAALAERIEGSNKRGNVIKGCPHYGFIENVLRDYGDRPKFKDNSIPRQVSKHLKAFKKTDDGRLLLNDIMIAGRITMTELNKTRLPGIIGKIGDVELWLAKAELESARPRAVKTPDEILMAHELLKIFRENHEHQFTDQEKSFWDHVAETKTKLLRLRSHPDAKVYNALDFISRLEQEVVNFTRMSSGGELLKDYEGNLRKLTALKGHRKRFLDEHYALSMDQKRRLNAVTKELESEKTRISDLLCTGEWRMRDLENKGRSTRIQVQRVLETIDEHKANGRVLTSPENDRLVHLRQRLESWDKKKSDDAADVLKRQRERDAARKRREKDLENARLKRERKSREEEERARKENADKLAREKNKMVQYESILNRARVLAGEIRTSADTVPKPKREEAVVAYKALRDVAVPKDGADKQPVLSELENALKVEDRIADAKKAMDALKSSPGTDAADAAQNIRDRITEMKGMFNPKPGESGAWSRQQRTRVTRIEQDLRNWETGRKRKENGKRADVLVAQATSLRETILKNPRPVEQTVRDHAQGMIDNMKALEAALLSKKDVVTDARVKLEKALLLDNDLGQAERSMATLKSDKSLYKLESQIKTKVDRFRRILNSKKEGSPPAIPALWSVIDRRVRNLENDLAAIASQKRTAEEERERQRRLAEEQERQAAELTALIGQANSQANELRASDADHAVRPAQATVQKLKALQPDSWTDDQRAALAGLEGTISIEEDLQRLGHAVTSLKALPEDDSNADGLLSSADARVIKLKGMQLSDAQSARLTKHEADLAAWRANKLAIEDRRAADQREHDDAERRRREAADKLQNLVAQAQILTGLIREGKSDGEDHSPVADATLADAEDKINQLQAVQGLSDAQKDVLAALQDAVSIEGLLREGEGILHDLNQEETPDAIDEKKERLHAIISSLEQMQEQDLSNFQKDRLAGLRSGFDAPNQPEITTRGLGEDKRPTYQKWWDWSGEPIFDPEGTIGGFLGKANGWVTPRTLTGVAALTGLGCWLGFRSTNEEEEPIDTGLLGFGKNADYAAATVGVLGAGLLAKKFCCAGSAKKKKSSEPEAPRSLTENIEEKVKEWHENPWVLWGGLAALAFLMLLILLCCCCASKHRGPVYPRDPYRDSLEADPYNQQPGFSVFQEGHDIENPAIQDPKSRLSCPGFSQLDGSKSRVSGSRALEIASNLRQCQSKTGTNTMLLKALMVPGGKVGHQAVGSKAGSRSHTRKVFTPQRRGGILASRSRGCKYSITPP